MAAEKTDIGLTVHRITNIAITIGTGIVLMLVKDGNAEQRQLSKDVSAITQSIKNHDGAINEIKADLRDIRNDLKQERRLTQKQ